MVGRNTCLPTESSYFPIGLKINTFIQANQYDVFNRVNQTQVEVDIYLPAPHTPQSPPHSFVQFVLKTCCGRNLCPTAERQRVKRQDGYITRQILEGLASSTVQQNVDRGWRKWHQLRISLMPQRQPRHAFWRCALGQEPELATSCEKDRAATFAGSLFCRTRVCFATNK